MKQKIGIYPGCSLEGTSREYYESVVSLALLFGIELEQVPDWNCCGATAAHNLNRTLALTLPARVLALAGKAGMEEIVVPCAACYNRLTTTQHELFENDILKTEVEDMLEIPLENHIRIMNIVQFIDKYILPEVEHRMVHPFKKKVACYYGCLLVRPNDILQFDRQEDPQSIDNVMNAIGAEPIEWPFKTECCGASLSVSRTDLVSKLSGKIVREATERNAEAIIVACPMCHANLDMRRSSIESYLRTILDIPVLYVTQAIGMACGLSLKQTGIKRHLVKVDRQSFTGSAKNYAKSVTEKQHG